MGEIEAEVTYGLQRCVHLLAVVESNNASLFGGKSILDSGIMQVHGATNRKVPTKMFTVVIRVSPVFISDFFR